MNERIRQYIDSLFEGAPRTEEVTGLYWEILQNTNDRYIDLLADGKSEDEAYRIAVSGIGNIDRLLSDIGGGRVRDPGEERKKSAAMLTMAIMLYILSPVPAIMSSLLGLLGPALMFVFVAAATGMIIYRSHRDMRGVILASAVMLYILSPVPVIVTELIGLFGVALMFAFIALATGMLIYRSHQDIRGIMVAAAVMLYILSPTPVILLSETSLVAELGVALMFAMIALATGILIYRSRTKNIQSTALIPAPSRGDAYYRPISAVVWIVCSAIYVVLSLATFAWHITWLMFLIALSICRVVRAFCDLWDGGDI